MMEESDYEPDSQQDVLQGDIDCSLEDKSVRTEPISLSQSNISFDDSSVDSRALFKKVPELNTVFKKKARRGVTCLFCDQVFQTVEISRLMPHIRKCKQLEDDRKSQITSAYERSIGKRTPNKDEILNELWAMVMVENNYSLRSVETGASRNL